MHGFYSSNGSYSASLSLDMSDFPVIPVERDFPHRSAHKSTPLVLLSVLQILLFGDTMLSVKSQVQIGTSKMKRNESRRNFLACLLSQILWPRAARLSFPPSSKDPLDSSLSSMEIPLSAGGRKAIAFHSARGDSHSQSKSWTAVPTST